MSKRSVVRPSAIHGKGLFACQSFKKGDIVEEIEGEIVLRESTSKYACKLSGRRSLILTNKTKYVNHSHEPNVVLNPKRGLIALRDIENGEELLSAYQSVFG
jgi:SET domain-containing protein